MKKVLIVFVVLIGLIMGFDKNLSQGRLMLCLSENEMKQYMEHVKKQTLMMKLYTENGEPEPDILIYSSRKTGSWTLLDKSLANFAPSARPDDLCVRNTGRYFEALGDFWKKQKRHSKPRRKRL